MNSTLYLKCSPDDIGARVLLSGDPGRVDRIAGYLENARDIAQNREYHVVTGTYDGKEVSAVSAGIGAPSSAIALEELAQVGAHTVVRVGTMMGRDMSTGGIFIPTGAVRYDGTSPRYLPVEVPAVPDWHLVQVLYDSARTAGLATRLGLCASFDAFYPDMAPSLTGDAPASREEVLDAAGVSGLDMESSLLFVAGRKLNLAVATFCLITVRAGAPPKFLPDAARAEAEQRLIKAALEGIVAYESRED